MARGSLAQKWRAIPLSHLTNGQKIATNVKVPIRQRSCVRCRDVTYPRPTCLNASQLHAILSTLEIGFEMTKQESAKPASAVTLCRRPRPCRRLLRPCKVIAFLTVALAVTSAGDAQSFTVVSPPGYADREGARSIFPNVANNFLYPDHPDVGNRRYHGRFQELHSASTFEAQGPGPFEITSLAWRPDRSVNEPYAVDWPISMRLATTTVGNMSRTFANNVGPGGLVEVYSGVVELATDGTPRSESLPHDFDYLYEFDRPFLYDPQQGDLLLDVVFNEPHPAPWLWADGVDNSGQYVEVIQPPTAAVATREGTVLFVTQFTVNLPPAGDFDGDGTLTSADVDAITDAVIAQDEDARYDLNDDSIVDLADHTYWVKKLRQTWFGDANLDGEFNSGDLITVFQTGKYEDGIEANSGWAEGDWDGDADFSSGDLVVAFQDGGYEQGPLPSVNAVPEPTAAQLLIVSVVFARLLCVRRQQNWSAPKL